ncbi:MAG TPA: glycosyltransferase [Clostridia bacterium]|nr:glycosyltransferase [Clostridia bacterium]
MKIAIVDDYLKWGGAVQVVAALHEVFPKAPIYTIFSEVDKERLLKEKLKGAKIVESWFASLPFCEKLISPLRFLTPLIWGSFDFSDYDLVISSASWAVTKGFAHGKTKEICYCHTPPRYLYGYETSRNWQKHWCIRFYAVLVNHFMRIYDHKQAQKVTWFIANSKEVQKRIRKFYRRESLVIYPPVEIASAPKVPPANYFLTGGRLEMPKNFDLVIQAASKLNLPLKVYGTGFQGEYLRSIAGPTVEFVGSVSEEEKFRLMAGCLAFVAAATDEDFGMTPVEAMAAGRPVIAYRGGGYLETVVEGKTGEFFDEPALKSLVKTLNNFKPKKYHSEDCRQQARKFSKERFIKEMKEFIEKHA